MLHIPCLKLTSKLFPPGNLHTLGAVAAIASAKSILIPFSRPLNVGGNSVNMPKYSVLPAAAAPSSSTVNTLFTSGADAVGLNVKVYFL